MGSSVTLDDIGAKIPLGDMQFHRSTIADLLGRQQLSFPGAQPVSFARKHFAELQRTDYFLCEKTDGIRCLLYLTSVVGQGEEVEAQFLIDRKNEYYYIQRDSLHLPRDEVYPGSFHTGTLLDGELVRQEPGNVEFVPYRREDDPARFFVYEIYRDEDAFQAHISADYGAVFNEKLGPLIVEPHSQLTWLRRV